MTKTKIYLANTITSTRVTIVTFLHRLIEYVLPAPAECVGVHDAPGQDGRTNFGLHVIPGFHTPYSIVDVSLRHMQHCCGWHQLVSHDLVARFILAALSPGR